MSGQEGRSTGEGNVDIPTSPNSPDNSDESLTELPFEGAEEFDVDAVDLIAFASRKKKKDKGRKADNGSSKPGEEVQKNPTASKGVQCNKEDITTAKKEDTMQPSQISQRPIPNSTARQPDANHVAGTPQTPERGHIQTVQQSTASGQRSTSRPPQLNGSFTSPASRSRNTNRQAGFSPSAVSTPARRLSRAGVANNSTSVTGSPARSTSSTGISPARAVHVRQRPAVAPQSTIANETPEQWYQRLQSEFAAATAARAQQVSTNDAAAPRDGTSTWLIRSYGEAPISLTNGQNKKSGSGCPYGCRMSGGEHTVDCPGLMATRFD